jgi:hypothetical protein
MPFTDAWNVTRPAGTTAAKQIDDEIRLLRLQLEERLEQTLVVDMSADPLVLKGSVSGQATGLQLIIPFSSFLNDLHARENDIDPNGFVNMFVPSGTNETHFAAVSGIIPVGCTITKIEYMAALPDAAVTNIACRLRSRTFGDAAPNASIIDTTVFTAPVGPIKVVASPTLSVVLDGSTYYYIGLLAGGTPGAACAFHAARITFDRPSNASAT